MSNVTEEQKKQMKFMGLLSPVMIVMFSLNAPSALPLYWTVGGMFLIIQTLLARRSMRKKKIQSGLRTKFNILMPGKCSFPGFLI
ncbi:inner membrane protein translocase [Mesobacillus boroniphilus JCM 21738]|uniref:Inner membrane protein translocase n=2 Tax=Mesobacillus boroniphilus TaxID=308892 RepID=W4RK11_9BACI|nr:inner membrane protein translocase [Mesobacillus boroniphilus JCM 21738]